MLYDVAFTERAVTQRCGGHVELVVAGQRMEVEHPLTGTADLRRQAHAENAVHPVERYAVHAVMAVQRVRVEIRVVDPARGVLYDIVKKQKKTMVCTYMGRYYIALI